MPLTDRAIKNAKPAEKPLKLFDGGGLFLLVPPHGGKWWRLKYRFGGKEKLLSLGVYPDVSLKEARDRRQAARKQLSNGIDPGAARKAEKGVSSAESFEAVAREWYVKYSPNWSEVHAKRIIRDLERDIFPWMGAKPINEIVAPELLTVLRRIEHRGAVETAHRALQVCGQVFRYGVATGKAVRDPSGDLKRALPPVKKKNFASITDPKAVAELLRALDDYQGALPTRCALKLAPLVFVRPGELRRAEWQEIDLDASEWRIPADKMKARQPHIIPLSTQAVEVLCELKPLTGSGKYVFPGVRSRGRPMSENTVNAALRRLGYTKEQMTGHGFRSMASTILHEQGWESAIIELQLSHTERNKVKAAYNFAQHLTKRREMMQQWADYLDQLRSSLFAGWSGDCAGTSPSTSVTVDTSVSCTATFDVNGN